MKDTRLGEDASIYSQRTKKSEREKWSALSKKEKWQYYKDYYLKYTLLIIAAVSFLAWILYGVFSPKPKNVLNISLINSSLSSEESDALSLSLSDYLDIDTDKENVFVDASLYIDDSMPSQASVASEQKMTMYAFAGDYDLVIADEEIFEKYAKNGFFANLTEALPSNLYSDCSSQFYITVSEDSRTAPEENGRELPYGISLKDFPRFKELNTTIQNPVLGIFASAKNKNHAISAIKWLTSEN